MLVRLEALFINGFCNGLSLKVASFDAKSLFGGTDEGNTGDKGGGDIGEIDPVCLGGIRFNLELSLEILLGFVWYLDD